MGQRKWMFVFVPLFFVSFATYGNQECDFERFEICLAKKAVAAQKPWQTFPQNSGFSARVRHTVREPYYFFSIPYHHIVMLAQSGVDAETIFRINAAFEKHKSENTHAFRQFSQPVPVEEFYFLAVYASAIVGNGIDPRMVIGIHHSELIERKRVGDCSFFPDKTGEKALVRGGDENDPAYSQKRFNREIVAFTKIYKSINAHLRHPRHRFQPYWPLASCGAGALGPMQIMPTNWLLYEKEVCSVVCATMGVTYASPYHLIPAVFGAVAILRKKAESMGMKPKNVHLDNVAAVIRLAGAYYAGPKNARIAEAVAYGKAVYSRSRKAEKRIAEILESKNVSRFISRL